MFWWLIELLGATHDIWCLDFIFDNQKVFGVELLLRNNGGRNLHREITRRKRWLHKPKKAILNLLKANSLWPICINLSSSGCCNKLTQSKLAHALHWLLFRGWTVIWSWRSRSTHRCGKMDSVVSFPTVFRGVFWRSVCAGTLEMQTKGNWSINWFFHEERRTKGNAFGWGFGPLLMVSESNPPHCLYGFTAHGHDDDCLTMNERALPSLHKEGRNVMPRILYLVMHWKDLGYCKAKESRS